MVLVRRTRATEGRERQVERPTPPGSGGTRQLRGYTRGTTTEQQVWLLPRRVHQGGRPRSNAGRTGPSKPSRRHRATMQRTTAMTHDASPSMALCHPRIRSSESVQDRAQRGRHDGTRAIRRSGHTAHLQTAHPRLRCSSRTGLRCALSVRTCVTHLTRQECSSCLTTGVLLILVGAPAGASLGTE